MYCIARRCVLPALTGEPRDHLLAEAALHSLTELLEAVPDPRRAHGLRYDLPYLLTCLIAALLCNFDSTEAVAQWCRDHVGLLANVFSPRLDLSPSGSLYRWLLPQLDASAIERVLGNWVQATTTAAPDEPLAFDGKTVRGARNGEQAAPHRLSQSRAPAGAQQRPLEHRKPLPLCARCQLWGRPLPLTHRPRSTDSGCLAQSRHHAHPSLRLFLHPSHPASFRLLSSASSGLACRKEASNNSQALCPT